MTREERQLPALRHDESLTSRLRIEAGNVCRVEIFIDDASVSGDGPDLFEALASARRQLEGRGIVILCNGARRDVFPSPMLRQSTSGRRAYVLSLPRTRAKPETVDIFDEAPASSALATVDEQRASFDQWVQANPADEELS